MAEEESLSPNIPEVKPHPAEWRETIIMLPDVLVLRLGWLYHFQCFIYQFEHNCASVVLFVFPWQFNLLSLAARQSFQGADLSAITSRELDLLIEESDQFFGGVCLSRFSSGHSQGRVYMSAGHFSSAPKSSYVMAVPPWWIIITEKNSNEMVTINPLFARKLLPAVSEAFYAPPTCWKGDTEVQCVHIINAKLYLLEALGPYRK